MNRIVNLVAPRGAIDFGLKLALFLLLIGLTNYLRDIIEHPNTYDTLTSNFIEASFVALPFCVFALALVRHMKNLQDQLAYLAATDMLTGLPNRRAFIEALEKDLPLPDGHLLMVDVDHFKKINDTYGHAVGDLCLKEMAEELKKAVRESDFVARLGGEEFGILLRGGGDTLLEQVSQRLVRGVMLTPTGSREPLIVTNSVGATSTSYDTDISVLLRRADFGLYQAKAEGRSRMVYAGAGVSGKTLPPQKPQTSRAIKVS